MSLLLCSEHCHATQESIILNVWGQRGELSIGQSIERIQHHCSERPLALSTTTTGNVEAEQTARLNTRLKPTYSCLW